MGGTPNAISVSPSKYYLGDDGNWSTFEINVGTPPQPLFVLPSTLVPATWAVLPEGCGGSAPLNCDVVRGNVFDSTLSSTWKSIGSYTLAVESEFGWAKDDAGNYGFDNLLLSVPQETLPIYRTVVAGIQTTDSYLGVLGLAARNFTMGETNYTSLLGSLRNSNKIPSLSYSYTAGAYYNNTPASLTFGGFDSSRFKPNGISFDFSSDPIKYLNLGLQSISFTGADGRTTNLLSDAITTYIDSTISAFWLPNDTCTAFANAYGLQFNALDQLYIINTTQHALNTKNNPQVSFQLGNTVAGGSSISINFPYNAFNMTFDNPTNANAPSLQIFPLRQALTADHYTLGRAFLQEAVLTVDFERQNFSLAQALPLSQATQSQIINIISPSDETSSGPGGTSTSSPSNPSSTAVTSIAAPSSSSISTGAIAAIVIAVVAIIAAALGFWRWKRKQQRKLKHHGDATMAPEKPLVPELATIKSPMTDYFPIQSSKSGPHITVSASEIGELESPRLGGIILDQPQHGAASAVRSNPAELPAGGDPAASELESCATSIYSGSPPQLSSPFADQSPDISRLSSPTAASAAEGAWGTSHMEAASTGSVRSVAINAIRGEARIVSHNKKSRSPKHGSPHGSSDNWGPIMAISSTGLPVSGLSQGDEIQRTNSRQRSNRDSQTTLVGGGLSGRTSPEGGIGTNSSFSLSALSSPQLNTFQRPAARFGDNGAEGAFLEDRSDVQTPSDLGEGSTR